MRGDFSHAAVGAVCLLALFGAGAAVYSQPDRADFDRAREQQRLRTQPTYSHNPVIARWDDWGVNLHAVVLYQPGVTVESTVIYPGGYELPIPHAEFDAVMKRYTRTATWRPD